MVGAQRLAQLVAGGAPVGEVIAYAERRMRAALDAVADGSWSATDVLDSAGPAPSQQHPVRIAVTLRKAGPTLTFDFTGSDPQQLGNVNAVEAVTVSAVAFAVRSVFDPTIPANAGSLRPVRVVAPPGTVVAARAAGGGGGRQRRGQPAGGRRVPRPPWPRPSRAGSAPATRER